MTVAELTETFQRAFGVRPKIFFAPGRVNLIGEHTDYNEGFVLPCAIGFETRVAISPRSDNKLILRSVEFPQQFEFDLDSLPQQPLHAWSDYCLGVAIMLLGAGVRLSGANLLVNGEVPIGAGLSSSAAIEVATAISLLSIAHRQLALEQIALLCQKAEGDFVGARVGIMDQFVSCLGKEGNALLLDCRSLDYELVPVPDGVKLVICNTMVKHELSSGEYNIRRRQCEEGVRILSEFYPGIKALRDVTPAQLAAKKSALPAVIYDRCLHVVEENRRVLEAGEKFRARDLDGAGRLMRESHRSLRDLYQVSCAELDTMVELAEGLPGFYGGRMTGGGFGGCTVNLVQAERAPAFARQISSAYERETGIHPDTYICSAANGAGAERNEMAAN
jgi:galactokinase